jgi:hypothetical protein
MVVAMKAEEKTKKNEASCCVSGYNCVGNTACICFFGNPQLETGADRKIRFCFLLDGICYRTGSL